MNVKIAFLNGKLNENIVWKTQRCHLLMDKENV